MTRTRKILGPALVALAMSAFVASSASASDTNHTGGHFALQTGTSATLHGHGGPTSSHLTKFHAFGQTFECTETYTGSVAAAKVSSVTITPAYTNCANGRTVHMNGCTYTFQVRQTNASTKHSPVTLNCPGTSKTEVTAEGCTTTFGPQTITNAVTYTTVLVNGVHALTIDVTMTGTTYEKHGLCEFLSPFGTGPHTGAERTGSILLTGSAGGVPRGITATGIDEGPPKEFHSEVSHTLVTGAQVAQNAYTFGVLVGSVECEVATVDGTIGNQTVGTVTVKPAYSKCKGLNREVTTHMNGCAYRLTTTVTGNDGLVEIECPAGQQIETTFDAFPGGCTVTIGAQAAGGVVDYKNEGAGSSRDLLLTWTLEGIDYERDGCEVGGKGNNGTLTGSVTLKGEDTSGVQKGIWVE